jgi:hypothetical protein
VEREAERRRERERKGIRRIGVASGNLKEGIKEAKKFI